MNPIKLDFFEEPNLLFNHDQGLPDPRDGLSLFGPLDEGKVHGIRAGVIGTAEGIRRFREYVARLQAPVFSSSLHRNRPPFPGFQAVFGIPWEVQPVLEVPIDAKILEAKTRTKDRYLRVYDTVALFYDEIIAAGAKEDERVDIWFVIATDDVYRFCRPQSNVPMTEAVPDERSIGRKEAQRLSTEPSLFVDDNEKAIPYAQDPDFHNQLKARLLEHRIPTQVLRESTIAWREFVDESGKPQVDLGVLESEIAWNISSAAFYKAGGRPWKLRAIRTGVCYIGIVFKRDMQNRDPRTACCAAQMFLDSGDGVVFKGDVGPWYNPDHNTFHLLRDSAERLVALAIKAYREKNNDTPPSQLFIHGKTRFNEDEIAGFKAAGGQFTQVIAVRITNEPDLRLFRTGRDPIMRGMAWRAQPDVGYLWTRGYIPRLQTYPGREVPRPLRIEVSHGEADLEIVLRDVLALTKLNYNACHFGDGQPVTLRFADAVGEILAGGNAASPPLPFKFYI